MPDQNANPVLKSRKFQPILGTVRSVTLSLFASRLVKRELSSRQTATDGVVFLQPSADVTSVIGRGSTLLARYTPSLACPSSGTRHHRSQKMPGCHAANILSLRSVYCVGRGRRRDGLVMAVKDDHFGKRVSFSLCISTFSASEMSNGRKRVKWDR